MQVWLQEINSKQTAADWLIWTEKVFFIFYFSFPLELKQPDELGWFNKQVSKLM